MNIFKRLLEKIKRRRASASSSAYIDWLRSKGVRVGSGCHIWAPGSVMIDTTRPSLVEIGNNVYITANTTILTHGFDWVVLRNHYGDVLASSGKVTIGNNVFVGLGATITKGVHIGDNSIIGAGSVVTKSFPPMSVIAGNPARLICTLDAYHAKRESSFEGEALEYAASIKEALKREPQEDDFWEEFPLFLTGPAIGGLSEEFRRRISKQLGPTAEKYTLHHKPKYRSFQEFREASAARSDRDGDDSVAREEL